MSGYEKITTLYGVFLSCQAKYILNVIFNLLKYYIRIYTHDKM